MKHKGEPLFMTCPVLSHVNLTNTFLFRPPKLGSEGSFLKLIRERESASNNPSEGRFGPTIVLINKDPVKQ
jgi:hypothetical protein